MNAAATPPLPSAPENGAPAPAAVRKRDGRLAPWDPRRIERAIALAFYAQRRGDTPNPHRDDPAARYGLDEVAWERVRGLAAMVERAAPYRLGGAETPGVEEVQDLVETCLAMHGEWPVARAYALYREGKHALRARPAGENGLAEFIAVSKYSRYRPELGRREVWPEAVERVRTMHLRHFAAQSGLRVDAGRVDALVEEGLLPAAQRGLFPAGASLTEEIWRAFALVEAKAILPSMRSLQFGGRAIEAAHARMFNCSFSYADRPAFFREALFLLLCGVGVGFSVQRRHVEKLPPLPVRPDDFDLPVVHHRVDDSIEGWADAVDALLRAHYEGHYLEFDFSRVRRRGAPIRTAGGKAPGHLPLKRCLARLEETLRGAAGRPLRPIEVYDMVMHLAQAVLSGGIRRSATLCLFSADDAEMAAAKTGDWFRTAPWRSYSNNSAVLLRATATRAQFDELFEKQKQFGEPGFYFSESEDYGTNPCAEIGLYPTLEVTPDSLRQLRLFGGEEAVAAGEKLSGWQMCNLTTINGARPATAEQFYGLCKYASLLGTLQACFTDIPYLGPVTRQINERDALLGVSICGVLDNPALLLDDEVLRTGAQVVKAANALWAGLLGRQRAARTTCVKPEGTASLLLGSGSGIHPHHARRYFRRVQVNRLDPVYRHFAAANPQLCERSVYNPATDDVVTFAVEAPAGALCRRDLPARAFLDLVAQVQRSWVEAGQASDAVAPGLHHNVSNTVTVRDDEWPAVADFLWENRHRLTGVALLTDAGDKAYAQAPREEVTTAEDIAKWNRLSYQPVDYTALREGTDATKLAETAACAGGKCDL